MTTHRPINPHMPRIHRHVDLLGCAVDRLPLAHTDGGGPTGMPAAEDGGGPGARAAASGGGVLRARPAANLRQGGGAARAGPKRPGQPGCGAAAGDPHLPIVSWNDPNCFADSTGRQPQQQRCIERAGRPQRAVW